MIYAYVISALVVFGAGFATSHKLDALEILKLESAIAQSNMQAEMTLKIAQEKVKNADSRARQTKRTIRGGQCSKH